MNMQRGNAKFCIIGQIFDQKVLDEMGILAMAEKERKRKAKTFERKSKENLYARRTSLDEFFK